MTLHHLGGQEIGSQKSEPQMAATTKSRASNLAATRMRLGHGDLVAARRGEIHVVAADARGEAELQLLGLAEGPKPGGAHGEHTETQRSHGKM